MLKLGMCENRVMGGDAGTLGTGPGAMLLVFATYPCCMFVLHVRAAWPCCMSVLMSVQHVHIVCQCCLSMLRAHQLCHCLHVA
jgi:hypothetical protein